MRRRGRRSGAGLGLLPSRPPRAHLHALEARQSTRSCSRKALASAAGSPASGRRRTASSHGTPGRGRGQKSGGAGWGVGGGGAGAGGGAGQQGAAGARAGTGVGDAVEREERWERAGAGAGRTQQRRGRAGTQRGWSGSLQRQGARARNFGSPPGDRLAGPYPCPLQVPVETWRGRTLVRRSADQPQGAARGSFPIFAVQSFSPN